MQIVLVVGERPAQASSLAERLGILGLEAVPCAREWKLAVRSLTSHQVSLILMDGDDGDESRRFFDLLRELTQVPIIVRGTGANPEAAIWYLDNGAADYVLKTMAPVILAAKINTFLRAAVPSAPATFLKLGDLRIDLDRYTVSRGAQPIPLTPTEFRLLRVLAENAGKACSQETLLDRVWGEDFRDCSHYLRLYMGYLRQKLEDNPRRPQILKTEWGYGYRLVEPRAQPKSQPKRASRRTAFSPANST